MSKIKDKIKDKMKAIKEDISFQKKQAKIILETKWNIGAEQGKEMKKSHKEKIDRLMKKDEQ